MLDIAAANSHPPFEVFCRKSVYLNPGSRMDASSTPHAGYECPAGSIHLTKREVDVLLLVAEGLEDSGIAHRLGVSVATVQTHVKNMRRKAGTGSRAGLVSRCYAARVLLPGYFPPRWSGTVCLRLEGPDLTDGDPGSRREAHIAHPVRVTMVECLVPFWS